MQLIFSLSFAFLKLKLDDETQNRMSLKLLVVGWFRFHSLISQRQSFGDEASTATCSQSLYGLSQRCQLGYSVQLNRWFGFVCAQNAVWITHSICICMGKLCQSQPNSSRSSWTASLNQFSKVNVVIHRRHHSSSSPPLWTHFQSLFCLRNSLWKYIFLANRMCHRPTTQLSLC